MWKVNSTVDICPWNYRKILGVVWHKMRKILFNEAITMKCQKESPGCSVKKVFWKFLQNPQEKICAGYYEITETPLLVFSSEFGKISSLHNISQLCFWNMISLLKIILSNLRGGSSIYNLVQYLLLSLLNGRP